MKKMLFLLVIAGLFYSCANKNDDPSTPLSIKIIGKWVAQKDTTYTYINNDAPIITTGLNTNTYIIFNNDGTGQNMLNSSRNEYYDFRYTIANSTITFKVAGQTHGNFIVEGGAGTSDVREITSAKLHLYNESEANQPGGDHYRSVYSAYFLKGK